MSKAKGTEKPTEEKKPAVKRELSETTLLSRRWARARASVVELEQRVERLSSEHTEAVKDLELARVELADVERTMNMAKPAEKPKG